MENQKSEMKKLTIIRLFNIVIISLFIGIMIITYLEYQRLNRISCIGLSAPPKYFVLTSLIPEIGLLIQLPVLLTLIRFFIIKK
jgi:hypothetical protein